MRVIFDGNTRRLTFHGGSGFHEDLLGARARGLVHDHGATRPERKLEMSNRPQWIEAFLRERRYAVLATHNDDGSTHLTPVWYLFEDGRFFVETFPESRKVRNVVT